MKKRIAALLIGLTLLASPVAAQDRDLGDILVETHAAVQVMAQTNGMDPQAREDISRLSDEGVEFIDGLQAPACATDFLSAARTTLFLLGRGVDLIETYEDAVRRADTTVIDQTGAELQAVLTSGVNLLTLLPVLSEESCA